MLPDPMLPDPRRNQPYFQDRFIPQPCQCIEFISCKDDDVEVTTRELTADEILPWLDGQAPTGQGSSPNFRSRLVIFPHVLTSDRLTSAPFSEEHVKELVDDFGFPDRFFYDHIVDRRLSAHIATRTGDCWIMTDWLFSAVTLQRTRNNDILSIIVSGNKRIYSAIEPSVERYISSRHYHRHPLFPIALIANSALGDYEAIANEEIFESAINRPFDNQHDPAATLAAISSQRERLTRATSEFKAFHASVRNLLALQDGDDASSRSLSSLQSLPAQAGWQAIPIQSMSPTLQYIIFAMGDILETNAANDTRLQYMVLTMQIRLTQRDTEVSLQLARTSTEIAAAAKRDSSSMKVIALLTTLFLPGAFVGTLLSTPEYSDGTPGSWRYWAITVPLTATVMLMLTFWMLWTRHVQKKEDAEEQERQDKG